MLGWACVKKFQQPAPNYHNHDFSIANDPSDLVVRAVRSNALIGTDLEVLLKNQILNA
jgi:hypothetical protein